MPSVDDIWAQMKADAKPERKPPSSRAGDLGKLSQKSGMATSSTSKVVETAELKETVLNVNSIPGECRAAAVHRTSSPALASHRCVFLQQPARDAIVMGRLLFHGSSHQQPPGQPHLFLPQFSGLGGIDAPGRQTHHHPPSMCDVVRRRARGDECVDCCQDERRRQ
jgi:hypothetical protein